MNWIKLKHSIFRAEDIQYIEIISDYENQSIFGTAKKKYRLEAKVGRDIIAISEETEDLEYLEDILNDVCQQLNIQEKK